MALALFLVPCAPPAQAGTLVVGNKTENTVSFLDLDSGHERARVETGPAPHEVAISPDGKQAAVVAYGGTTVDVFDVAAARRIKRIDLSPNAAPHGIAWLRTGRIVIAAEKSKSVVIVGPRRGLIRSIPTDQAGTHMLVVSPDRRLAYASNIMAGTVSVIDLREGKKLSDIAVGGYPEGLALTPDGRQLWVGDDSGGRIRVVDLATMETIDTLPADPVPVRIAISPDGKTAICSNIGSGTLNVFDVATRKPLRTITVSGAREAVQVTIAFSHNGKLVYVAETGRDTIAEVDLATGEVLRRLTAGKGGDGLGIAP